MSTGDIDVNSVKVMASHDQTESGEIKLYS